MLKSHLTSVLKAASFGSAKFFLVHSMFFECLNGGISKKVFAIFDNVFSCLIDEGIVNISKIFNSRDGF
jgi:hypothetical protein